MVPCKSKIGIGSVTRAQVEVFETEDDVFEKVKTVLFSSNHTTHTAWPSKLRNSIPQNMITKRTSSSLVFALETSSAGRTLTLHLTTQLNSTIW